MSATTRERPILFSAPMVRAILDGSKTQTRRVAKHPLAQAAVRINSYKGQSEFDCILPDGTGGIIQCPYGKPGDRLWVREAWRTGKAADDRSGSELEGRGWPVFYEADNSVIWTGATEGGPGFTTPGRYRHARFMPRWASRAVPEITDVRLQRLQEISEGDARAEGIAYSDDYAVREHAHVGMDEGDWIPNAPPIPSFHGLWDTIHGSGAWHANPRVWAITFRRIQP